MMVKKFDNVIQGQKEFILTLPHKFFMNLLRSDHLDLASEHDIVDLIKQYFARRKDAKWLVP